MRTQIKAAVVIAYRDGDHHILRDGQVVFEDERIVFVGKDFAGHVDETIDAGNAILSPGFIDLDALADIDHALIDTWQDEETGLGLLWSEDYFRNRRKDVFPPEDRDFKHFFAFSHLIRNGVTTAMPIGAETHNAWAETYDEMARAAESAGRLGLRVYLGPSYRAGVSVVRADGTRDVLYDAAEAERGLEEAIRFVRDFGNAAGGLVNACLLPCRIETLTPELMRRTAEAQRELGCLVRLHCLQEVFELEFLEKRHGRTPLQLLQETGLLGPNLLVPHGWLIKGHSLNPGTSGDTLETIAASGMTVIHCPMTSIRYAVALETFDSYRAAGVNIALGTDSFPPDMIRNMDYGTNVAKLVEGRLDAGKPADLFRAATLGGARALGRDDLGRIAPGALADLVVVDLADPRIGVVEDPIRTLLMNCSGANIRMVAINGRLVLRDGKLLGVNEAAMRARAQDYFERMKAAYCERDYLRRPSEALFPPSFPAY